MRGGLAGVIRERVAAVNFSLISRCGGNVVSVHHNQSDTNMAITSCYLRVGMETRDHAQVEQIKQELAKAGFKLVANQQ